jgi:hypothetical protein
MFYAKLRVTSVHIPTSIPSNLAALASMAALLVHRIMISHIDGNDFVVVDE